jgi:hypothetical protein
MEEMALDLGMITETREGGKKGQQARLSQYENRPNGPPLTLVSQYADYFGLQGVERFDFFMAALGSAEEITVNAADITGVLKDVFLRFLAGALVFERPCSAATVPGDQVFALEKLIGDMFPGAFLSGDPTKSTVSPP